MEIIHLTHKNHNATIIEHCFNDDLKNKASNCILYSQDGSKFKIHREILCQTQFLREILMSTKDLCCEKLEILCPCSKTELKHLVNFLYDGEIHCKNKKTSTKIQENLSKIFGFPKYLNLNDPNQVLVVDKVWSMNTENFESNVETEVLPDYQPFPFDDDIKIGGDSKNEQHCFPLNFHNCYLRQMDLYMS